MTGGKHLRKIESKVIGWHDRQGRARTEEGLTLIELIVVIAIVPLVVGALSVALISVISQDNTAGSKTTDSGDASVVSANFVPDVLSSGMVTTDSGVSGPPVCGGGSPVVSLQWGASPTVVSYTVGKQVQFRKTNWVLYRYECFGSSGTPTRSTVVAHNVQDPTGAFPLTATIGGSSTSCGTTPGCTAQSYAKTNWASTQGVSGISITVKAPELATTYSYTLTGVPRASSNASRNSTPPGNPDPLIVVQSSGTLSCGNSSLTINGSAEIQSSQSPTVSTNQGSITATGGIYTNPGGTVSGNVNANGNPITAPTGNVVNDSDPYGNITPPSTTGLKTFTTSSGSQGPGIYTNGLSLAGLGSAGHPYALQSGVYIVQGGVSGNGALYVTNATGGVLFYIETGGWGVQGGSNTSQNFTPWTSPFSPAPNLLIWEASGDTSAISLGGGNNDSYAGVVYAPTATVSSNGSTTVSASDVVAGSVVCGNGTKGSWTVG